MNTLFYHLKIAIRNLRRETLYSVINIGGLAVSLAAVILISLWVKDELTYDKTGKRPDDTYLLIMEVKNKENVNYWTQTSIPMAQTAKDNIPEVEETCVFDSKYGMNYLAHDGVVYSGDSYCRVDTSFFRIFETHFLEGSSDKALAPNSIVLTRSLARKIFGNDSALGKHLTGTDGDNHQPQNYYVSAVIEDFPASSFLNYGAFCPFESTLYNMLKEGNVWGFQTFLMLRPGSDPEHVARQMTDIYGKGQGQGRLSYRLQLFNDMHLYDPSGKETSIASVRIFIWIALFLLLIACVNYVNLVTSRAVKRNKEIGIKKVLGAKKRSVFGELMNESVMLFLMAMPVAFFLILILMPFYNQITGKNLSFAFNNIYFWAITVSSFVLIVILAGIYPAVKMTVSGMKGLSGKNRERYSLRKVLVVFQFTVTVVLVVATIVINRQLHFILNKQLGFDKEQVCSVNVQSNLHLQGRYHAFKAELEQLPVVAGVTATSTNILDAHKYAYTNSLRWEGMEEGQYIRALDMNIDDTFFETMDIPLVDGTGFTHTPADAGRFYINETAVRQMGLSEPVGKKVTLFGHEGIIAGVVRDFHFRSLGNQIDPVVMNSKGSSPRMIYIRFNPGKLPDALAATEEVWKKYNRETPFTYEFLDETLQQMYQSEQRKSTLFNYFSVIAILISCLGLFGLITYTAETKTKEIGIRKVLGASVAGIVELLSKEFLILVGIAMIIAFPLAYYWLNRMLQDYAYRIDISWWMFALAGMITVALTLLTVGWKAVSAATANPVKAIKRE